jgi:UDP-GlcNAc:undecaprenyl-phosphate GlcNAc-1-phosphate transferase
VPTIALILPLAVAFLITFALVPQVRKFAIECRVADKPNGRRMHTQAIPHLGGVAIFSGFFLGLLVSLGSLADDAVGGRVLALLPSLLVLFGLGLADDLRGLRATVKLTYQILGAVCVVAMGAGFQAFGVSGAVPYVGLAVISIGWYVGVCNSINLIDGLDGLAAGTAALAAIGFLLVGLHVGDEAVAVISVSLLGALAAFLRFNFHPARIFMGDTGSMFIGFALASLACLLARHLGFWTTLLGSAAMLGLPILDTFSAICRRLAARRHIFQADGEHTHHRLMRIGLSHRGAVLALYVLAAAFTVLGYGVLMGRTLWFAWAAALGVVTAVSIAWMARRAERPAPAASVPIPAPGGLRSVAAARAVEPVPVRVIPVPVGAGRGDRREDVLAALPPAASGPS